MYIRSTESSVHTSYMLYVLIRGSSRESNSLSPHWLHFSCSITPEQKKKHRPGMHLLLNFSRLCRGILGRKKAKRVQCTPA